jgi:polyisoprenoid-binding protein YceI
MQAVADALRGAPTWVIDPARSTIEFQVSYLSFARVRGRFTRFSGSIGLEHGAIESGWSEVCIDATSIETGSPERDRALREDGFFETTTFKFITFRAKHPQPRGGGRYRLIGDLTIRDVESEIELDMEVQPRDDGRLRPRMCFAVSGSIDRKRLGVHWNPLFDFVPIFIGHVVKLEIKIESVQPPL